MNALIESIPTVTMGKPAVQASRMRASIKLASMPGDGGRVRFRLSGHEGLAQGPRSFRPRATPARRYA